MKKLFVLFAVITALTVNTFAYTPSFLMNGESLTTDNVFKVRITAKMTEKNEADTTDPETSDSGTDFTDDVTEISTDVKEDTTVSEYVTVPEDTTVFTTDVTPGSEITDTDTSADASAETDNVTDAGTDTDGEDTQNNGIFGGEGTVVFDTSKLRIVSALPCTPEGVTVVYAGTDGAFRFMFYSENALEADTPLLDIQFKIISGQGNVSVTLSEGIFSNGDNDTPCEDVSFTAVYETKETSPVTTARPADSVTSDVTTTGKESSHHTENNTEETKRNGEPTEVGTEKEDPATPEPDSTVSLPTVIVVSAVVLTAAVTAVIIIVKRTKE